LRSAAGAFTIPTEGRLFSGTSQAFFTVRFGGWGMRYPLGALVIVFLTLLTMVADGGAGRRSSCVACHTDEGALKRLCKVPDLHAEEGG